MREIRTGLICFTGLLLTVMTYESKYGFSFLSALIYFFLIAVGISLSIWAIISDLIVYQTAKITPGFLSSISALVFTIVILTIVSINEGNFNKPTLLEVYYDGDTNRTRIDFKTDGTYIVEDFVIGFIEYQYGTYKIKGDLIIIKKPKINYVIESNILRIVRSHKQLTLVQIDQQNKVIDQSLIFNVIKDNR